MMVYMNRILEATFLLACSFAELSIDVPLRIWWEEQREITSRSSVVVKRQFRHFHHTSKLI